MRKKIHFFVAYAHRNRALANDFLERLQVNWPGIIKHSNDPELIYVHDQSAWDGDTELHSFDYAESDRLIDSSGRLFSLTEREHGFAHPRPNAESMALRDILGLVKAHAAQKGACCVAKLYAPTIAEAFKIVASLDGE